MNHYLAAYTEEGRKRLATAGFRPTGQGFAFMEDDPKTADIFFRRFVRNMLGVILHPNDYVITLRQMAPAGEIGFLDNPNEPHVVARPGQAGGRRAAA